MSAFRTLRQLTLVSCRVAARPRAASCRTPSTRRTFSTTLPHFSANVGSNLALSSLLVDELLYEVEGKRTTTEPAFLTAFREQGVWTIEGEDVKGRDQVTLVRGFGNETIRAMFAPSDVEHVNKASESEQVHWQGPSHPIRVSFAVTKDNAEGVLNVDTVCRDGAFLLDHISFYPDAQLTGLTLEADWACRRLDIGPRLNRLDGAVRQAFEKWLGERGLNEDLATFISHYATHKEHKEYVEWLWNLRCFVPA